MVGNKVGVMGTQITHSLMHSAQGSAFPSRREKIPLRNSEWRSNRL